MAQVKSQVTVYPSNQVAVIIRPQVVNNGLLPRVHAIESAAKALAPVGKGPNAGRLKRSIHTRARSGAGQFTRSGNANIASYEVVAATPYAGFVSRGTRPHIIESHGPWPLRNRFTGQVFGRIVHHPGTVANPYLERALRQGFLRG